jgi:hypothetical protein
VRNAAPAVGIVALQLLSCGSSLPPCQDNNCTLPGRTTIKWTLDSYPEWLFQGDSCLDMGASTMRVDLVGIDDPTVMESSNDPTATPPKMDPGCSDSQYIFLGLPPGNYTVSLTPLDGDGNPIVSGPTSTMVAGGQSGADTEVTVNVPYTAWTQSYTGTFLFRLSWAGMSCAMATPPVATQTLTMTAGGAPVTALTDTTQRLDGTDPEPCRAHEEQFSQFVQNLPFGPATLFVVGKDAAGVVRFQHQFDTFVGATRNNPTITFDVPPPDAAVDAPVDTAVDAAQD